MAFALEAKSLSKKYETKEALSSLNLGIEYGEVFCLLGPNGAGKSTTINLFLGFLQPTAGEALVDGLDIQKNKTEIVKKIAYIPENVMLYPNLTGIENLSLFSSLAGARLSKEELQEKLSQAGLQKEAHNRRTASYSKGMRQKVGIAIALSKNAKILLLDEPTSGLDPQSSFEFSQILNDLKKQGTAIFMATHDIFRAKEIATRIGIMKSGKLIDIIDPQTIDALSIERTYLKYMEQAQ